MIIKLHHKPLSKHAPTLLLGHARKVLIALTVFVLISYFFWDKPVALYFQHDTSFRKGAASLSNIIDPFTLLVAIPILFFLNRSFWKKDKLTEPLKLLVFALPFSFFLAKIIKFIMARDRPKSFLTEGLYGFHFMSATHHAASFPSGHACVIGAIVGALACFFPRYTWRLLFLGILLSFCRVITESHFLSDAVAGAVLGALVSQWLYALMKKHKFLF